MSIPDAEDLSMAGSVVAQRSAQVIGQLADAGCRYIADTMICGYTAYVDDVAEGHARPRRRPGGEHDKINSRQAASRVDFDDVTFRYSSLPWRQSPKQWHGKRNNDAIAERFFNELHLKRFLLEYDSARSGQDAEHAAFCAEGEKWLCSASSVRKHRNGNCPGYRRIERYAHHSAGSAESLRSVHGTLASNTSSAICCPG